jgi:hypothetical protein
MKLEMNTFAANDYASSNSYLQHHQHQMNCHNFMAPNYSRSAMVADSQVQNYDYNSQTYYNNRTVNPVSTQNLYAAICVNGAYGHPMNEVYNVQHQQRNDDYLAPAYSFLNGNSTSPHSNSPSSYNTCSSPLQTTTLTTTTPSSTTGPYVQQYNQQSMPSTVSISNGYNTANSGLSIENQAGRINLAQRNTSDLLYGNSFKPSNMR